MNILAVTPEQTFSTVTFSYPGVSYPTRL